MPAPSPTAWKVTTSKPFSSSCSRMRMTPGVVTPNIEMAMSGLLASACALVAS